MPLTAALPALPYADLGQLLTQLATRGEAPALHFEGRHWSYAKLARRVARAAARLAHVWGVQAGDRVLYLGWNHIDQITLLLALARLGAVLAPLNTRLAAAEWAGIAHDCRPCLVLHDHAFADAARAIAGACGVRAQAIDTLCATPVAAQAPLQARASAPVLLVYTSGTTGQPRGALHTQANLLANMAIASQAMALQTSDTVLSTLPLFHVGGLCIQTLPAVYAGAQLVLHPRFEAQAWLHSVQQLRPSLSLLVPAAMKALVEHPDWARTTLGSLRAVWAGSSVLPDALVQAFHARGLPLCNVYGSTESGPFSVALGPAHSRSHVGSCGWPAPGVACRLLPLAGASDGVGELLLRAPNVAQRYWPDQPALDSEGWLHTGDLATQAADGSLRIVGRAREMIISGGENIYPAEIENLLAQHPAVQECAVLGLPDPQWGEVVVAAVVPRPGSPWAPETLLQFLAPQLARYKLPRHLLRCEQLPKTALGKVQRALLAQHCLSLL